MDSHVCRGKAKHIWISSDPAKAGTTLGVVFVLEKSEHLSNE